MRNDFSCFCWPGKNTWKQDVKAALSLSLFLPNCWHGGVWWGGRLKRHAWTSAVPQWAAKGENHVPRWCLTKANKLSEGKLICQKLAPKCKTVLVCYILFCRHREYLRLNQQMGSHTQADTDLILCLHFQDHTPILSEKIHHCYKELQEQAELKGYPKESGVLPNTISTILQSSDTGDIIVYFKQHCSKYMIKCSAVHVLWQILQHLEKRANLMQDT